MGVGEVVESICISEIANLTQFKSEEKSPSRVRSTGIETLFRDLVESLDGMSVQAGESNFNDTPYYIKKFSKGPTKLFYIVEFNQSPNPYRVLQDTMVSNFSETLYLERTHPDSFEKLILLSEADKSQFSLSYLSDDVILSNKTFEALKIPRAPSNLGETLFSMLLREIDEKVEVLYKNTKDKDFIHNFELTKGCENKLTYGFKRFAGLDYSKDT